MSAVCEIKGCGGDVAAKMTTPFGEVVLCQAHIDTAEYERTDVTFSDGGHPRVMANWLREHFGVRARS